MFQDVSQTSYMNTDADLQSAGVFRHIICHSHHAVRPGVGSLLDWYVDRCRNSFPAGLS